MSSKSFLAYGRLARSERIGSAAIGATAALAGVAMLGLTRRIGTSVALIAVGAALIGRGAAGVSAVRAWRQRRVGEEVIDIIDQSSMDSFPASDAPAHHSFS